MSSSNFYPSSWADFIILNFSLIHLSILFCKKYILRLGFILGLSRQHHRGMYFYGLLMLLLFIFIPECLLFLSILSRNDSRILRFLRSWKKYTEIFKENSKLEDNYRIIIRCNGSTQKWTLGKGLRKVSQKTLNWSWKYTVCSWTN